MNSDDQTDEAGAAAGPLANSNEKKELAKDIYGKAKRNIEEHELTSPVAIQFMIEQIAELKEDNLALKKFREGFYKVESDLRVEKGKSSLSKSAVNVSSGMLSAGSAGAGIVASFLQMSKFSLALFIIFVSIAGLSFFIRTKDNG